MFKKIYVEITNVCNLSCSFCSEMTRKKEFISIDKFKHIIGQIKPFGSHIYLHIKGEPLLHPQLCDILKICADNNIKVDITTNGTLLEQNKEILINSPVRQINISLHSLENSSPNGYLHSVINFAREITQKTPTVIVLRKWVEISENDYTRAFLKREFNLDNLSFQRSTKLEDNIFLSQAEEFDWPRLSMPHISNRGFCYGMRSQIGILVCGTVVPCCLDADGVIALGNIYQQNFSDIINSPRGKLIAENFSRRHATEELCRKCTYKERFTSKL